MQNRRRNTMGCLVAVCLMSSAASADCTFQSTQDVDVFSTHWNDVLFFNYSSQAVTVAGPVFGHRSAAYAAPKGQWLGAFLYDYALARFVEAEYSRIDRL